MEKSKLERISELTRISRERALTEAEQEERTMLRRQYAEGDTGPHLGSGRAGQPQETGAEKM